MGKLNALKVKSLARPGRYGDGKGLWLQVRGPEQKSWLFRFAVQGKQQQMGLGPVDVVSLAQAREAALDARKLLHAGINPLAEKKAKAEPAAAPIKLKTFREVGALYLAAHESTWRNDKHRYQWRQTLDSYVYPEIGDMAVASVVTGDVLRVIQPLWTTKPETAARVRGRIETILDYAKALNWRQGDNPARWRGHMSSLLPARSKVRAVEHHAAMPWKELPLFMEILRGAGGTAAIALQFTILTACRTTEAIEAKWSEIDMEAGVWTVPAERMKANREHRVPLSAAAVTLLRSMLPSKPADRDGYVFLGGKKDSPLSNMAMTALLRRLGRGDLTVHGFRSSFRDWAAEATNHPREIAEAALAHTLKDKTEASYQRGDLLDKRRVMMADWAEYCHKSGCGD